MPKGLNALDITLRDRYGHVQRSMSPPFGRKLLMNGFPFAKVAHLTRCHMIRREVRTPVWKIGHRSTLRGLLSAGSRSVPKMASSKAVPATAGVFFKDQRPLWPLPKSKACRLLRWMEWCECGNCPTEQVIIHVQRQFGIVEVIVEGAEVHEVLVRGQAGFKVLAADVWTIASLVNGTPKRETCTQAPAVL